MTNAYIPLPLNTNPDDLAAEAFDYLIANVPGWLPADGHLETWMTLVWARMQATTRDVTVRTATDIFRYYGEFMIGLTPIAAEFAVVPSTWTMIDTSGYTVPAGTLVGLRVAGDELILFEVVTDFTVPPGSLGTAVGAVQLRALDEGVGSNGIPAGPAELVDSLAFVDTVTTTAVTAGGIDAETDGDYLNRLVQELRLLTPRPILPDDFPVLARRVAGVHRAIAIDNYSPGRTVTDASRTSDSPTLTSATAAFTADDVGRSVTGVGIPGGTTILTVTNATTIQMSANATSTATGATVTFGARTNMERAVTVAVVDADGAPLDQATRDEVKNLLESEREINFRVEVISPTYTVVNIAYTITVDTGYEPGAVVAAVDAAVEGFISPANWGGGDENPPVWRTAEDVVRYLEVAAVIYSVNGVRALSSLTLNGAQVDVPLTGVAPLPDAASTVTGSI